MKRSLVAATAVALLLTGCATGETGHLDPQIDPDLSGPFTVQQNVPEGDGAEVTTVVRDVEALLAESSESEPWFGDVAVVQVVDDSLVVLTVLSGPGQDADAVCEAAFEAGEGAGLVEPAVEVRDADGGTLSERDGGAGARCSG